ncbi:MAG: thiamine-phosphate kinase [Methanosphaera sp. rholeuAM270]|nr:MAG: thiamine-phosphate kinase [Methanosphaera sp. rholeuAM270]
MEKRLISEVGEKRLIKRLLDKRDKKIHTSEKIIEKSYRDDAALILNSSEYTVLSTDMLIEHSHIPKEMTHNQMGQKVVTVNISDILAMNAEADSILVSMGLPPNMTLEEYDELTDGILDACEKYCITLIGGDINQSNEIILCGTSIGKTDDEVKLQTCINENELIGITGSLGSPAAALDILCGKYNVTPEHERIVKTLLEPKLPIETSKILRKYPEIASSITDITDGLAIELGHLQDKNKDIGFEIYYEKIPYDKNIEKIAEDNDKDLTEYLLHFGEEFELLLTLNPEEYKKHENELKINIIGKTNNTGKITLIKDNKKENIPIRGYEHLKR